MGRLSFWVLLGLTMFALSMQDVHVRADAGPTESECRPYIEKAIHELKAGETSESAEPGGDSQEQEASTEDVGREVASAEQTAEGESAEQRTNEARDDGITEDVIIETVEETIEADNEADDEADEFDGEKESEETDKAKDDDDDDDIHNVEHKTEEDEGTFEDMKENAGEADEMKSEEEDGNANAEEEKDDQEEQATASEEIEDSDKSGEDGEGTEEAKDQDDENEGSQEKENEGEVTSPGEESKEVQEDQTEKSIEDEEDGNEDDEGDHDDEQNEDEISEEEQVEQAETIESKEEAKDTDDDNHDDENEEKSKEKADEDEEEEDSNKTEEEPDEEEDEEEDEDDIKSRGKRAIEDDDDDEPSKITQDAAGDKESGEDTKTDDAEDVEDDDESDSEAADAKSEDESKDEEKDNGKDEKDEDEDEEEEGGQDEKSEEESQPEDDLLLEVEIPENLRDRKHIDELLHLDDDFEEREQAIGRVAEIILRDLKRIYENAIKPLETLYKYRDLSNRHFGDPEIFSKPLILFMGPWSGGKSTIINYLAGNEYTPHSLRSGAEPSPAYFNIVMYGNETEILDGTQLAADWTFSGLQKFGQGLEDRLRGLKLPSKLLEKVNIVEIPGILEVRKQVSRLFPFNDACQWFIDRADIIFLVYDPAKLDVGPETEAILDQLKGREYQTRIILNKADTVKPEELLRVQSALIWNISPLMSSAQPPVMYTASLWSHPYETSSPIRLLQAQERAFLRDIRTAIDKRIENKIASARRFAVRVRNHAKMVDCYLTTYYNHKTLFGNKKRISDQIIENPQNYHIYEGLSTLTNISRYDLPDPEVYRDFFRLNPLYEFKKLSETCTYFRGCPINKLDVAIAYDLPELVGKYKKMAESALASLDADDKSKS